MLRKKRFGIRLKIMLGYLFIILCLMISFILINKQVASIQKDRNYIVEHDLAVHEETNRIEKLIMDMESAQWGYLLTGDVTYLEPYKNSELKWRESYNELSLLISDNPGQLRNLTAIKASIEHWIMEVGDPSILMKKKNLSGALTETYQVDPGKDDIEEIRSQFATFRKLEKGLTKQRSEQLDAQHQRLSTSLIIMLSIVSVFSLAIALLISQSIVGTMRQVNKTIIKLASSKGEMSHRIRVNVNDEVKDLADATNILLESHQEIQWQQKRLTEVISMLQGISNLETLGKTFITKAADLFGASYGVFYLRNQENNRYMVKLASYAAMGDSDEIGVFKFRVGEGLVGQSAAAKRMYHLTKVPDNYISIASGLGNTNPRSILIVPVEYNNEAIAVMELATLDVFTPLHMDLLKEILEVLGTIIHSVQTRVEVERLLRESQMLTEELQTQAEELQTQQEELRITNEQLEEQNRYAEEKSKELEHIKVSLEEYAKQLQQSSQYKSEFMANMSHELRTPLNSVLILSQMLAENGRGTLTKEEQEYAGVIHSAGNDLLLLINDILDLSKVEAGKLEIHIDSMNLNELPDVLKSQFGKIAEQRNIGFIIKQDSSVPDTFYTDEQRFYQIMKNLLSNAFKFTHEGSVQLELTMCEPEKAAALLPAISHRQVLAVSVRDTGIGIPKDKQELIFEPFRQADGTTNRKYGGTGLGLSICRELAGLLGGCLTMESVEGLGSTFTLYIPTLDKEISKFVSFRKEAAAAYSAALYGSDHLEQVQAMPDSSGEPNAFKGKKVLVVDDDVRNVFTLSNALENEGITVIAAHDGQECLEILAEDPEVDLILMDIMMPVMDGYEAMRAIRKDARYEHMPIIALTAKAMKQDREICLEAGASDYISKPLSLSQLFSLMRVWLTK
ncbi:CHASE3 domain-containing protein [Paenibacillus sedimenti]|uniref:Circadian input-output histidine kinase CikA n=1 Tax=Paenibacillus sedimenti TaxID=2770274 RepID=A0A926KSH2_9BACL|nr:response regulator [Paenibacillus sedimenti]MBD0383145.1 response regulator [Paenibacillus sedimenti]